MRRPADVGANKWLQLVVPPPPHGVPIKSHPSMFWAVAQYPYGPHRVGNDPILQVNEKTHTLGEEFWAVDINHPLQTTGLSHSRLADEAQVSMLKD